MSTSAVPAQHRLMGRALAGGAAMVLAVGMSVSGTPALAAEPCTAAPCTVAFHYSGAQESWTVPANVTELTAVVAGAAGNDYDPLAAASDGATVTVALDTALAGQSLSILVGGKGQGTIPQNPQQGGGGGSFLALGNDVLIVAGGGGGGGAVYKVLNNVGVQYHHSTRGGNGSIAGPAGDGTAEYGTLQVGKGATPSAPGAAGTGLFGGIGANAGIPASITGGSITPGRGGFAVQYAGGGGGGYFGGGGGSAHDVITNDPVLGPIVEFAAGGGGSGYLAPGLVAQSTGANVGDGYISFSYRMPQLLAATGANAGLLPGLSALLLVAGAGMSLWRRRKINATSSL